MKQLMLFSVLVLWLAGCGTIRGNIGSLPTYKIPEAEAIWIRNGEPLIFENERWYPQDRFGILLDSEVYMIGEEDRGVAIFVEKADVRPFNRLYTKFGKNKFRIFKKNLHDQDHPAR